MVIQVIYEKKKKSEVSKLLSRQNTGGDDQVSTLSAARLVYSSSSSPAVTSLSLQWRSGGSQSLVLSGFWKEKEVSLAKLTDSSNI